VTGFTNVNSRDRVEALFLTKILSDRNLAAFDHHVAKNGLNPGFFQEPMTEIIEWVVGYRAQYNELPTPDTAQRAWPELPTILAGTEIPEASISVLYDEVAKEAVRVDVLESLQDLHKQLTERTDPFDIKDAMSLYAHTLQARYSAHKTEIKDFREYAEDLEQDYNDRLAGVKLGIPCPFLFIQEQLGGWHPAQITSCVAPTGLGKTWFIVLNSAAGLLGDPYIFHRPPDIPAWTQEQKDAARARVLIVSLEMAPIDVARRQAAVLSSTSFNRLMKQKLSDVEKAAYFEALRSLKADGPHARVGENLRIVGPNQATTPDQVAAQAEEFGADLVLIDGFYYMEGPGKERWQKVEGNMRQMRLHTLMSNRHYMLATQLRRNEGTLARSNADAVAFSQSISHDSNNLVFLVPPKDAGNNARVIDMKLGKVRDGAVDQPYRVQWDLYDMRFAQLGPVQDMASSGGQAAY